MKLLLFALAFIISITLTLSNFSRADVRGYVKTTGYYFTDKGELIYGNKKMIGIELGMKFSFPFYDLGKGSSSFKFYANNLTGTPDNKLSLNEGYLDIYTSEVDLRLGKQYIFWGRADGTDTPTNNINPRDLTRIKPDPEEERIAVDALKTNWYVNNSLVIQGVWIPEFTPSKLPEIPLPSFIILGKPITPSFELKNSSWGLKIDKFTRGVDFSFDYLYGWDSFPDYKINLPYFVPTYNRIKIYGADFSTGIRGFDIRGEAAYFQTRDKKGDSLSIKNPYLQYVFEMGYPVTDNLNVIGQLIGKNIYHFKSPSGYPPSEQTIAKELSVFYGEQKKSQYSLLTHITYSTWYDKLKLEFIGIYNLTMHDYFLSPKISYELGKGLNLGFGAMVFEGKSDTQFGMMDNQDFVWLETKYSF